MVLRRTATAGLPREDSRSVSSALLVAVVIEDTVILTVSLIDAALLAIMLLSAVRTSLLTALS